MASRLLAEAQARPELIARGSTSPTVTPKARVAEKARIAEPFPALALLSDPAVDIRQYLEDLVSIAITSAQQAEDVSARAQEASRKARRSMAIVASFGALGLVIGAAGFAASRSSNIRLSDVREQVGVLQDMQRQAQDQLADIAARTVDQHEAVEATRQPSIAPAAVVTQAPLPPTPSVRQQPQGQYYQPWPDSRPQPRRTQAMRGAPVVMPQFVADIQRNFRAIFR